MNYQVNQYSAPAPCDYQGTGGQLATQSPGAQLPQDQNPGQAELSWDSAPVGNTPTVIPIGLGVQPINEANR